MTYEDYLKHFADLINERRFEEVFSYVSKREYHIRLVEDLFDLGINVYSYLEGFDEDVAEMEVFLENSINLYYGESLCWLADQYGNWHYLPAYVYYFKTKHGYNIEELPRKFSWKGSDGQDWYVCPSHLWDIQNYMNHC